MKSNSLHLDALVVGRDGMALTAPITTVIHAGEMLVIHGSNGSGKSTLLKTVAGLLPLISGKIRLINGEGVAAQPLYMGHQRGLTPSLSVLDNVTFWARASKHPELILAAMRYFELEDAAAIPVGELSAGWQQRVALTRLITMPSSLWLLDEPTANLDHAGMALLQSLIETRRAQGGVVVVASHMKMHGELIRMININTINDNHKA